MNRIITMYYNHIMWIWPASLNIPCCAVLTPVITRNDKTPMWWGEGKWHRCCDTVLGYYNNQEEDRSSASGSRLTTERWRILLYFRNRKILCNNRKWYNKPTDPKTYNVSVKDCLNDIYVLQGWGHAAIVVAVPGFRAPEHLSLNPDSVTKCVVLAITALRPLNLSILICKVGTVRGAWVA